MINSKDKILITGSSGLVGSALIDELLLQGYTNLDLATRRECDLTCFDSVRSYFSKSRPTAVFHLAGVAFGGAMLAKAPGSIFVDNILINTHVIEASRLARVQKIVAMGSTAAYSDSKEIVKESEIWDGPPTAQTSYGHAKRAMLAQLIAFQKQYDLDFAYILASNLYGPHDWFDPQKGRVIPSLIQKFYVACHSETEVSLLGDGTSARDFLYSKDLAQALVLIMNRFSGPINVGSGQKTTVREIADQLIRIFPLKSAVRWDTTIEDKRKWFEIDLSHLRSLGFESGTSLEQGLRETADWYLTNQHSIRF